MRVSRLPTILTITIGLAAILWAAQPPPEIVFDGNCHIHGLRNRLSAILYPRELWASQLAALHDERDKLSRQQAIRSPDARDGAVGDIERKMRRLSDATVPDEQAEQRWRLERIGWLDRCETDILNRRMRKP